MSNYGTIPTSSNAELISRAKQRVKEGLGRRRPWKMMLDVRSMGIPKGGVFQRVRDNLVYFQMNYALVVLLIIFLSLLWFPISLIVFLLLMAAWLFLYFLRDEPLFIFGRLITDRLVLLLLSLLTLLLLLLTAAIPNILFALLISLFLVLLHALFRTTDHLFLDDPFPPPPPLSSPAM